MQAVDPLTLTHGLFLYGLLLLAGAGVPLPIAPALLVIGAMSSAGQIHPVLAFLVTPFTLVPGDALWFFLGRRFGQGILNIVCRFALERDTCIRSTQDRFARHGLRTLLVARFIPGLSTLASPMAGAVQAPLLSFLPYELGGAFLYTGCYVLLGYLFAVQLGLIVQILQDAGIRLTVAAVVLILLYIGVKLLLRWWLIRQMRSIAIDPAAIPRSPGREPLIVDLRGRNDLAANPFVIPGARRWKMEELLAATKELPQDTPIILICACPNDATSTRAALTLRRKGFANARPLRGGVNAWRAAGLPVEPASAPSASLLPA